MSSCLKMLLELNLLLLLISAVFATPPISEIDEKGLKSDTDDQLTNSIDDNNLDDRSKRSYESGGYQWGSPNQADPFNPAYSPPNNFYGFGRSGNDFPGASNNPFKQSPFDRGQPNNNYGKSPLQDVMGKALETVIVQSVRHLLDMTPMGSGQGDFMRSARSARSVENVLKNIDNKQEKLGKENIIEKLGSFVYDGLEKRANSSEEEDDESVEDPDSARQQQILLHNIIKELKRRKRMRQQANQQSLMKNQEKTESQKINQLRDSKESWEKGMNDEQKLQFLSNYQKQLMDLYREKQNKSRADKNSGNIRDGSKQPSSRYSSPQQARTMRGLGDYPIDRQEVSSKYFDQRQNKAKPFLSSKYSQIEENNSRFRKEGAGQGQDFGRQDFEFEKAPQNSMMNNMGQSGWNQQTWNQNNQFVQRQNRIKDNSIQKMGSRSMIQQNLNQLMKPEEIRIQEGWGPQMMQPTPQNQQFYNDFPTQSRMMSPQIQKHSNGIPGKQRFQRISTNEICNDGFTPSGIPCTIETTQNQINDGTSFVNPSSNQEMLLQPPTLIKRYVTYSNRFIPPPTATVEPVTDQEMLSGQGTPQTNSIGKRFSDDAGVSSQEQRSQGNEGMMNGWGGQ
ncbi:uncharacterized protein LOC111044836 [Nilaparvata lugens]|uniref:uncharacterized protein LOC111044836 n=1 Tax=Nilaparvata lugens TaxID=108931 RepID=UPI000B989407|nr:uncharacterized protein LOC111044836 [Nilaparvata lugens]XP_022185759.1 uncharacterized protein LOC111044836 [Nilaparvata lugens]